MSERINTKAVLEKHTWEGALWNPDELRAAQAVGKELYAALAQDIADREAASEELEALREAADDFIAKCDRGEARSIRSYAKFRAARALRFAANKECPAASTES